MFNQVVGLLLRESLFSLLLMLLSVCLLDAKQHEQQKVQVLQKSSELRLNTRPLQSIFPRGALAQLVRAPPCHGGGCGFEPRRLRCLLLDEKRPQEPVV